MPTKKNRAHGEHLHVPALGESLGYGGPTHTGPAPIQRLDHAILNDTRPGKKAGSKKAPISQKGESGKAHVNIPSARKMSKKEH